MLFIVFIIIGRNFFKLVYVKERCVCIIDVCGNVDVF